MQNITEIFSDIEIPISTPERSEESAADRFRKILAAYNEIVENREQDKRKTNEQR